MKETSAYTKIYDDCGRKVMFLSQDGLLSLVEETYRKEADEYTECIVRDGVIRDELDNPALAESSFTGKMEMLFGNYDGLARFQQFCDDRGIDTMTLTWE